MPPLPFGLGTYSSLVVPSNLCRAWCAGLSMGVEHFKCNGTYSLWKFDCSNKIYCGRGQDFFLFEYCLSVYILKFNKSTAHQQLKSPWSLSGKSIHLTLVTKWSWSWSWMTYCHPLCAMSIGPPILRYSYFKIWPWKSMVKVMYVVKGQGHVWPSKFKGQGYGKGQTHWSSLRPGVQSICLLFIS